MSCFDKLEFEQAQIDKEEDLINQQMMYDELFSKDKKIRENNDTQEA